MGGVTDGQWDAAPAAVLSPTLTDYAAGSQPPPPRTARTNEKGRSFGAPNESEPLRPRNTTTHAYGRSGDSSVGIVSGSSMFATSMSSTSNPETSGSSAATAVTTSGRQASGRSRWTSGFRA